MIRTSENRTPNYVGTVISLNDATLKKVREIVKEYNKNSEKNYRLDLKGRLGDNNPNAYKYHNGALSSYIRQEDASRFDVYLYMR